MLHSLPDIEVTTVSLWALHTREDFRREITAYGGLSGNLGVSAPVIRAERKVFRRL
jgi:hypothetical protein